MPSNEWKLPLNLAIAFHVLLVLAVVYLPNLLNPKERLNETYTVSLVNLSDLAPSEAPAAKTPPAKEPPPKQVEPPKPAEPAKVEPPKPITQPPAKKVVEKAIALDEPKIVEPTPVAPPAPPEAVSLKPTKRKIKSEVPPPPPKKVEQEEPTPPKKPEPDLSQQKRQKLAEMLRAEQKAAEEAQALAEEAELERRLAEATLNRMKSAAASTSRSTEARPTTSSAASQSDSSSALEKQYYAAVMARVQAFWSLPEYKDWDPTLKTTVVITVDKNGQIAGSFVESQSGDKVFDRFVSKTLQDVGHLPPIPAAIRKDRLEIGLNFTPGGIR